MNLGDRIRTDRVQGKPGLHNEFQATYKILSEKQRTEDNKFTCGMEFLIPIPTLHILQLSCE